MRRRIWAVIVLAAIAIAAVAVVWASAQRAGRRLLVDSYQAEREFAYLGRLEIELLRRANPTSARLNVMHAAPDKTRSEVVFPKDVEGYLVINKGDTRYIYSPKSNRWYGNTLRPPEEDVQLALKNYRVRVAGRDKVAGRPCRRLKITPRYAGNPSKIIWVDDQTGLSLRRELRNADGEVISRARYSDVLIKRAGALSDDLFRPPEHAQIDWDTKSPPRKFAALKPTYIPPGYRFDEIRVRFYRGRERAHLRYTDGLNTISVFEEIASERPRPEPKKAGAKSRVRRGTLYWQLVEHRVGDLRVVLMGDIAGEELDKMAKSIPPPK